MGKIKDQLEALMDATGKQASDTAEKMKELQTVAEELAKLKKSAPETNPFATVMEPSGMLQELESIAQLTSPKSSNAEEAHEKLTQNLANPVLVELKAFPTGPDRKSVG